MGPRTGLKITMWLIVIGTFAVISTALFLFLPKHRKQYKLGLLTLLLWGTTIMVFIDHLIAFLEGEPFLQTTTSGLIKNSYMLGIAMLIPLLLIWLFFVIKAHKK